MAGELELIEGRGVLEELSGGRELLAQVGDAAAEGEMPTQLEETNQVTAAPTAMTVEQVLMGVDVEGGMGFLMQRTETDELGTSSNGTTGPVVLLQVLQQRKALFEPFQILAHGAHVAPRHRVRSAG